MEQWEYWPTYLEARATKKDIKQYLREKLPGISRTPKFMVEAVMPQLNAMGEQGWELVHMEPVPALGKKGDVLFGSREWSNVYFCVLKRRKPGSSQPVTPLNAAGKPAFPAPAAPVPPARRAQPSVKLSEPQPQPVTPTTSSNGDQT